MSGDIGSDSDTQKRETILAAAAGVFFERGFEAATTLEIARRAKTSKRALYAYFSSKEGMLAELIRSSVRHMREPLELPAPESFEALIAILEAFGRKFLTEYFHPDRVAMYRLALAEAHRSGQVARELDASGRRPVVEAMEKLFAGAVARGLVAAGDVELAIEVFFGVLIGGEHMMLLLGVLESVSAARIDARVALATLAVRRVLGRG